MIQTTKAAHRTIKARDLDVFYREAGPKDAPTVPLALCHRFVLDPVGLTNNRP